MSWSGHERNCAFLNLGGTRFVDASAISGLDFDDDARACVTTDLDGDGDVDVVLKNRSGPQLRLLRNDLEPGPALWLELRDRGGNRDAIGARVELTAGPRRLVRCVSAGDGYLSQSSRRLHFGLGGLPPVERLEVRWPDGTVEAFAAPDAPGRHLAVRGTGRLERQRDVVRAPAADPVPLAPLPTSDAVVLREPLALPPTLLRLAFRGGAPARPVLLACWAQWCAPCAEEIAGWAAQHRLLQEAGLDVVLLGFDAAADHAKAALRFQALTDAQPGSAGVLRQRPASAAARGALEALLAAIVGETELALPMSLLVDTDGRIQVVYLGAAMAETLVADTLRFGRGQVPGPLRSRRGGRWAFEVPRAMAPLAKALRARDLTADAEFFERIEAQRRAAGKSAK